MCTRAQSAQKIDAFINRRQEIADHLQWCTLWFILEQTTPLMADWLSGENCSEISWHLYTVQIDFDTLGMTRSKVMKDLREQGIGTQVYIPVHLQPWYQKTYGYATGKCPVAESYYTRSLSLPLFQKMKDEDVATVVRTLKTLASFPIWNQYYFNEYSSHSRTRGKQADSPKKPEIILWETDYCLLHRSGKDEWTV